MRHLYKVALTIITVVIISCLSTLDIYAYADHKSLVIGSFDILADEQEDVYQFYFENYVGDNNYKKIIFDNSFLPDDDESIDGTHYYVYEGTPSTNGLYYKNRFSHYGISARTRFEDHYGNAINCYENGDYNNAMQSLGRAIHYLQDIGCTPHSTGMVYIHTDWPPYTSAHGIFENYIDANLTLFITEAKQNHVANYGATDFGQYDLSLSSYEEICNSLAAHSSQHESNIDGLIPNQNSLEYRSAAIDNVSKTLSYIAGLLYKFYYDVEIKDSCHEIKSGSTYFIKHVGTGKYLRLEDINTLDVTLDDFDGSINQQFELTHDNASGAFQISSIAYPSQKIIIETENYTLQHSSTNPEPFKIIYDGYEHYRIASQTNENSSNDSSYNYTRYLNKISSNNFINCPSSDPTDSSILWDFIEVIDYNDAVSVTLSPSENKFIYYTPPTSNEYIIETSQDVVMQIYEQSTQAVCMIYNSEESQVVYSQTLHQFDMNCSYYIRLFNPSEVIAKTVDLTIMCLSGEFTVSSSKNIELTSNETKIYKIDLSETEMMTLYTSNRNVLLQLYELVNNNLIFLCDNSDDVLIPLTEEIEEEKLYYLYTTSSTSQTIDLFISYNASFASSISIVTENDENDDPMVYHESITTFGEIKFYQFTPLLDGLYYFRTKASQNGNTYMELYNDEGTLLSVDDNSGDTWSAKINYQLLAGEDYYFSVRYKFYQSVGQYDLQIYNEDSCIWKINWQQIAKDYANMGDFTIITDFYIWSIGIIDMVDINTRTVTFSSMTWSYSIVTQEPYLYQTIGMIIGSSYLGEYIDPNTSYTCYSYLLVEGGGELDTEAVIPNTWYYECTYYDVSIEFSVEELEYYLDQEIIRFEPIESV